MSKFDPNIEDSCDAKYALLQAPDGQRIERHAIELLSKAMNGGRVVAFVGAGASMAYGRISWRDLVIAMQSQTLDEYKSKHDILAEEEQDTPAKKAYTLLNKLQIKLESSSTSNDFLTGFQLAEQLDRLSSYQNVKENNFRERVKTLVKDDKGHAQQMLREIYDDLISHDPCNGNVDFSMKAENLKDGQEPKEFRSIGCLNDLIDDAELQSALLPNEIVQSIQKLISCVRTVYKKNETGYLRPYHRFLNGVFLSVLPEDKFKTLFATMKWGVDPSRAELLPWKRDPLMIIYRDGIRRFITTNYDSEIERLFASEGFRLEETGSTLDQIRDNPLGFPSRDIIFDRDHIGDLLAFAARDAQGAAEVVHLHGRADGNHSITVTEADYQERYLSEDNNRSGIEDALAAALGGNPILFLGSGIGEDDILRPLRQFVGSVTPNGGRLAIALLPAEKEEAELELNKIRNLQRYGVYTIHFGNATLSRAKDTISYQLLRKLIIARQNIDVLLTEIVADGAICDESCRRIEVLKEISTKISDYKITHLEDTPIDRENGLSIDMELCILNAAIEFCDEAIYINKTGIGPKILRRLRPSAKAFRRAVAGAMDSITGAFLCARLIGVRRDWEKWRTNWLQIPEPEQPELMKSWFELAESSAGETNCKTKIYKRHTVWLLEEGDEAANIKNLRRRFPAEAISQTFNALIQSLHNVQLASPPKGRRIFLLIFRRGIGKGHFFAALSNGKRLGELQKVIGAELNVSWPFAAFFSLSFSHEVSSTFDQLTEFLLYASQTLFPDHYKDLKGRAYRLYHYRVERLRFVLQEMGKLAKQSSGNPQRLIVAYNNISILFDEGGRPKNTQVARIFEILIGETSSDIPVDFIFICGEKELPLPFRKEQENSQNLAKQNYGRVKTDVLCELHRLDEGERRAALMKTRWAKLATIQLRQKLDLRSSRSNSPRSFAHFLYAERASVLGLSFFPSVALALAWKEAEKAGIIPSCAAVNISVMKPTAAKEIRSNMREFLTSDAGSHTSDDIEFYRHLCPALLAGAALIGETDTWNEKLLKPLSSEKQPNASNLDEKIVDILWEGISDVDKSTKLSNLKNLKEKIDAQFRRLNYACGEGRFAFTVLMATAYEFLIPIADDQESLGSDIKEKSKSAIDACHNFIEGMLLSLEGLPGPRRDDRIVEKALKVHAENHAEPGRKLPREFVDSLGAYQGIDLFDLQQSLLWHLAVIGQPVIAKVLARSPLIIERVIKLPKFPDVQDKFKEQFFALIEIIVEAALWLLEQRCLVLPISRRQPLKHDQGDSDPRWSIHRVLQRHIFKRLHAPFVEYADVDIFRLTLYTDQPNDVPRLTPEAHKQLHRTVAVLIGYPGTNIQGLSFQPWPTLDEPSIETLPIIKLRAQMMRAAFGIVRSVYSLSTISRFEPDHTYSNPQCIDAPLIKNGFFEDHRLMVRWTLRQAIRSDEAIKNILNKCSAEDHQRLKVVRPFYSEEIVWLYNECAVLSFVQGRMSDAIVLFDRADDAAKKLIEPNENGALRAQISLNRVLADIERGRLKLAEDALARIIAIPDEHPAIYLIAIGLRGLVDHIRGRHETAKSYYRIALYGEKDEAKGDGLIRMKKSRAASLISKHYGDLLRSLGEFDEAEKQLRQGTTLALEGGHEEARHQILLSTLRLEINRMESEGKALDGPKFHARLDAVERYARTMGMPRLQAEVDQIRTQLLRKGGDLKTAAAVASRGLAIASANDLRLRKTSLLLRLAEIYADQELYHQCTPLLRTALEMSRDNDFFFMFEVGQKLHDRITRQGFVS